MLKPSCAELTEVMADYVVPPTLTTGDVSHCYDMKEYSSRYEDSVKNSAQFWLHLAEENFYWKKTPAVQAPYPKFDAETISEGFKFWPEAQTNICYNVLDRICERGDGDKIAFYWEGNDPDDEKKITYAELLHKVKCFSNALKTLGVSKGDRVAIYMPMVIELPVAMLSCARIGAIHSIVFAGFSAESLSGRITDCQAKILITADGFYRGDKLVKLKTICDEALKLSSQSEHSVKKCVVLRHLMEPEELDSSSEHSQPPKRPCPEYSIPWKESFDIWWHDLVSDPKLNAECEPEWMGAEEPLFILYTSGSTGKPKGMLHTIGGYMVYTATTFKYSFNYNHSDVYFCTADIGWITGHSYVTYGPMANGATSVIFEGTPLYPDAGRLWAIVEKYKVSQVYTAPTAIRMLMKFGDDIVRKYDRSSLKILGTVGEPINPDSWRWYYEIVGDSKCPIVDTYWQTETGGHIITNVPYVTPMKPGSASFPFFGIEPALLDEDQREINGAGEGYLVIKKPWPGIARSVFGDHKRYIDTYFKRFPGYYMTGDRAKRDSDGYYWIVGRVDDMLNVSGHLLSTAEIESALVTHENVVEAAVIGKPHKTKGECVYGFITLKNGAKFGDELQKQLGALVRQHIGAMAIPDYIQNAPNLPKTRSGKIMRRVLRKIAAREEDGIGDTSTLAEPKVVEELIASRPAEKSE